MGWGGGVHHVLILSRDRAQRVSIPVSSTVKASLNFISHLVYNNIIRR